MKDFVFLLGRPGCGKSFIFEKISEALPSNIKKVKRIDDFPVLKELLDRDTQFKRHIRKEGGFEVTDWTIVDDVLKEINNRLPEIKKGTDLIFVEFARRQYLPAFKNFSEEIFSKSLICYIYVPFEICLERNRKRFEAARDANLDDHIVPTDLMKTYYREDDIEKIYESAPSKLKEVLPADFIVIDNSSASPEAIERQVAQMVKKILEV